MNKEPRHYCLHNIKETDTAYFPSIAPNNSGTIFGLSNTVGHISGFLMPVFIGALTNCPVRSPTYLLSL